MIELKTKRGKVCEPARQLAVDGEYDVVVVGGGVAGSAAGIAAARMGCKTLILERESAMGGLATLGLVNIPLDYAGGIGQEWLTALEEVDGHWHRHSDPEKHKLVLDRMAAEAGCAVLYHTMVVDSIVHKGAICGVVVESKSGRQAILARRVVDASGDADAAAFAGTEFAVGRPGDGYTQACSLEFRMGGVDFDAYKASDLNRNDPKWIRLIAQVAGEEWAHIAAIDNHLNWMTHLPGRPQHCGKDEVSLCICHSRRCRPLDNRDLTRMYIEGREQADAMWRFIKAKVPGFENCWLIDTGTLLGVRDSRRVLGEYVLTGWDIACRKYHDDVITISKHGYDIHGPDAVGNIKWIEAEIDGKTRYVIGNAAGLNSSQFPPGGKDVLCDYQGRTGKEMNFTPLPFYDIPYRSLLPAKVDNLLVAGRCLSADFPAQSGSRLILACTNMGQAAGTAAALSLACDVAPRKVDPKQLQRKLIAAGMDLGQTTRVIPGLEDLCCGKG
ncbi:MAG TPA: FAD-dependent oxidoreductase [Phycisphaerales bacterium]|nr:FAD-dependent oxidoreductase [Phycisphaerales bacterium]